MLLSHFSALAFLSATAAFSTSPKVSEKVWQIAQNPSREERALSAPAVSSLEEIQSVLDAPSVTLLYEFEDPEVNLENVAARSNGHLLLTATSHPHLYIFDPESRNLSLLYSFPGCNGSFGIVEAAMDVFIVAVGNYSGFLGISGSFGVWSVDLKNYDDSTGSQGEPIITYITDIPEARALNGVTKIEGSSDLVLIADSALGGIWRLNITSGNYSMAIKHVLFSPGDSPLPLGINGIRTHDQKIHFSNSAQRLYGSIAIDETGGATGEPEIIAGASPAVKTWDDLAIDWEGNGWIATHANGVTEVTLSGKQRNVTSDQIHQPTSLIFGRGPGLEKRLYVVTAGGLDPGQIFSVDTWLW